MEGTGYLVLGKFMWILSYRFREWTPLYSKLWWCAFRDSKVFVMRAVYAQSDGFPLNHTNCIQALMERAYFDLCITQCIALVAVIQLGGDDAVCPQQVFLCVAAVGVWD